MWVFHNVSLQFILLAFASLVHSFQFTNKAFNPVLGQQFTITWVDSTGSVTLHLAPIQYYNQSVSLASAVSIGGVLQSRVAQILHETDGRNGSCNIGQFIDLDSGQFTSSWSL